jgi:hypothetical protein
VILSVTGGNQSRNWNNMKKILYYITWLPFSWLFDDFQNTVKELLSEFQKPPSTKEDTRVFEPNSGTQNPQVEKYY